MELSLALALKATATAATVVIASMIAERATPAIAAMVLALPVSAGPAYMLLALQHDDAFVARASLAGLPVNLSTALLVIVYAAMARRGFDVVPALGLATLAWFPATLLVRLLPENLPIMLLVLVMGYAALLWASWPWRRGQARQPARRRWFDVPLRAGLVATIVVTIVSVSDIIGPVATGSAILFPTTYFSFMLLMHRRLGGPFVACAMIQSLFMLNGFIAGLLALHLCGRAGHTGLGLLLLWLVPVLFALSVLFWLRRRARP